MHPTCVKWTASGKLSQLREPSSVLGDDLGMRDGMRGGRGKEGQEGGDICIHTADSLRCTAGKNTTL